MKFERVADWLLWVFVAATVAVLIILSPVQPNYLDMALRKFVRDNFKYHVFKDAQCIDMRGGIRRCTIRLVPQAIVTVDCATAEGSRGYVCTFRAFLASGKP